MIIFLVSVMCFMLAQVCVTAFADKSFPDENRHYPLRMAQAFFLAGATSFVWLLTLQHWIYAASTIGVIAFSLYAMKELSAYQTFKTAFLRNPMNTSLN